MTHVAVQYAMDPEERQAKYRAMGATSQASVAVDTDSTVEESRYPKGMALKDGWVLALPLLFEVVEDDGVFSASALNGAVHTYAGRKHLVLRQLQDSLVDLRVILDGTPDDSLDQSAIRLRDQLRKQLKRND